jgi:hypothetical protein
MAFAKDEFPEKFKPQRVGLARAKALANLPPEEIAGYFRDHPFKAKQLLDESSNKRFTPSTFIQEKDGGFRVGWFSVRFEYMCVRQFSDLADAAADYLLFSLGKGRWKPPEKAV